MSDQDQVRLEWMRSLEGNLDKLSNEQIGGIVRNMILMESVVIAMSDDALRMAKGVVDAMQFVLGVPYAGETDPKLVNLSQAKKERDEQKESSQQQI